MRFPLYQVDAFTSKVFGGNPAAVVLLPEPQPEPLPERTMQAIGAENNLSETAFVQSRQDGNAEDTFGLRWFTPMVEVDLCGHATLASAFVLFREGRVTGEVVHFETQSGRLSVRREGDMLTMDFPARPPAPVDGIEELTAALGARPDALLAARDHLAVFTTEDEVASLSPDFARLADLEAWAVIATAPGNEVDFVSRFFAPKAGIDEDPVTGSAHCTLIPYWAGRLGKMELRARQISRRGGEIFCAHNDERVAISGRAVLYLQGEISV